MIKFDDFQKVELKIAKILEAEKVEGSEKLVKHFLTIFVKRLRKARNYFSCSERKR